MWLYSYNGKKTGPVSFEEIVKQVQAGVILPETAVCEVGQKPCRAKQHQKLIEYFLQEEKTSQEVKTAEIQWVYVSNGQRMGPVSFADIINLINSGGIQPDTAVCEIGQQPCRAGQHPLLSSLFQTMNMSQTSQQGQFMSGQNDPANSMSFGYPQQASIPVAQVAPVQQVAVPSIPVPEDQWFLSNDGTNGYGPYPTSQVVLMIQNGQVRPQNLAWRNGENAVQISILPLFSRYFENRASSENSKRSQKKYLGTPLSRTTYILFGVFLGWLGVHNFYAGYTASGVIKLVFSLCAIGLYTIIFMGEIAIVRDPYTISTFLKIAESCIPLWSIIEACIVTKDARGVPFI